jgi:multiple sugar transport system permease protein
MTQPAAVAHGARGGRGRRRAADWLPVLLTLPALAVVFAVIGMPLVYSLVLSLHRINILTQRWVFVGLENYADVLPDPDFLAAFGRTAVFALATVTGGLVLGMGMALVLNMRLPARGLLRSVTLIPWAMSPVAVGILWGWIFNGDYGPLNAVLLDLGITSRNIYWLGDGTVAFALVALVFVWNHAPLTCLLLLAGLQSMPENLHRAARIDGAGPLRRFVSITLPWLRPMLLLVLILSSINAIMAFDLFWTITRGGPGSATTVFSWMGYAYAFQFFRFGEGAAILYVLTIACLVLAALYLALLFAPGRRAGAANGRASLAQALRVRTQPQADGGAMRLARIAPRRRRVLFGGRIGRAARPVGKLVAWLLILAWSAGPFLWLVVMSLSSSADLARSPPALVPNGLVLDNYRTVLFPQGGAALSVQAVRVPTAIWNSLIVAFWVTAVNVVLGSLAGYAYGTAGRPGQAHGGFLRGSLWALMLTRMTPSLALILPFFIVFKALGLLDTRTALVIAYCSLILPLSTWIMRGYFEGMPPNLEKAALVDGCTRLRAIVKVVLPVARPGIVATAIFCFLVSWNEFIFALILTGTPRAQTIPVVIAGFLVQLRFYDYGPMFAASVLAVLPPVVITLGFQRYLVSGMLSGSLKG